MYILTQLDCAIGKRGTCDCPLLVGPDKKPPQKGSLENILLQGVRQEIHTKVFPTFHRILYKGKDG
jgi:hypothetical protein